MSEHELVLRPGGLTKYGLVLVSLVFVVLGAWMVRSGEPLGWPGVVFFGPCLIVAVINASPGASELRLGPDGLRVRSLFRTQAWQWDEVGEFRPRAAAEGAVALGEHRCGAAGHLRATAVVEELKPVLGNEPSSLVAFLPSASLLLGGLALRDRERGWFERASLIGGKIGAVLVLLANFYAIGRLLGDYGRADATLILVGIAVGHADGAGILEARIVKRCGRTARRDERSE